MTATAQPDDVRPVVPLARPSNRAVWLFAIGATIGGALLFSALNARRQLLEAPQPADESAATIGSPPPLDVPAYGVIADEAYPDRYLAPRVYGPFVRSEPVPVRVIRAAPVVRTVAPVRAPAAPAVQPQPSQPYYGASYRNENPAQTSNAATSQSDTNTSTDAKDSSRVHAFQMVGPSTTVPQGTIIQAVLETALDSTRAGGVRALVSRDVKGFDGTQVLIPRGSRLIGEYAAELKPGQNRALIQWKRLTRPDGVQIALDSPSSDPLGRAGVKGKVNSHFLERFGGALLQSVLDIGTNLASRRVAGDGVVIALPGSSQTINSRGSGNDVQRTLTVRQGTGVSVFVARDLDFSTAAR
ncbi:TrbI/VirB10 family protein [Parablastomonas sp. CN1-191]|uniref:TrbI/VirB10 family protein n=1 Tax=Parablastomonas sp. CN1-191 TaxID=3400908 RepID=UPI003BF8EC97